MAFDRKAEVELAGIHGLVAVLHLPGLRRAFGDDADHLRHVEPGLLGEMDAFGKALDEAGDADWLTILVSWPAPAGPISPTILA